MRDKIVRGVAVCILAMSSAAASRASPAGHLTPARVRISPGCRAAFDLEKAQLALDCAGEGFATVTLWLAEPGGAAGRFWSSRAIALGGSSAIDLDPVALAAAREGGLRVSVVAGGVANSPLPLPTGLDTLLLCNFEGGTACGIWSSVVNPEICNGVDEDCDAEIDEEAPCDSGLSCCGAAGCIDVQSNVDHCGECGFACPVVDHGSPACDLGECGIGSCDEGFEDCDGQAFDGCESELATDTDNCGECGFACPLVDHGVAGCASSACGIESCDEGYDDCDTLPENGCEANLGMDDLHCGNCNSACAFDETCLEGICSPQ